ncbi:MAG: WGR domain-containing protein, partial [Planctomycetaceae bacterium]
MPLTRYYFDDGKARKFWSCSVSGKTLVTCYGRLDATGRETKKKMTSPAAAKAEADKQAATKLKKGYIKVDSTLVKIQKEK